VAKPQAAKQSAQQRAAKQAANGGAQQAPQGRQAHPKGVLLDQSPILFINNPIYIC